ncbi:MAG: hypothetical protein L0216_10830, partial [Planctomycetales bacterium]|nr:hypothetical protein [Planctomycetales bacterium]
GLEETLLARARGSHVDTVVVGGEVVVRGGRHVGVDRAEILKALRAALRAPRRRTDLAAAAVLVWPHIARYYSRWLEEAGETDGKLPL